MAYNHDERVFFTQLNCPRYIEDKNNNRFDVVDRLEFIRNKIRNCKIQIDDYIKEKENLGSGLTDLGLRYILDRMIKIYEDEIKDLEEDLEDLETNADLTFGKDNVIVEE